MFDRPAEQNAFVRSKHSVPVAQKYVYFPIMIGLEFSSRTAVALQLYT